MNQTAIDLDALLRHIRPRAYEPHGPIRDRIHRRLEAALARETNPAAERVLDALKAKGEFVLWADETMAPHISVTEYLAGGGAQVWHVHPPAVGCIYLDSGWRYWPDAELDSDIPTVPIALGVDDWCLNYSGGTR